MQLSIKKFLYLVALAINIENRDKMVDITKDSSCRGNLQLRQRQHDRKQKRESKKNMLTFV